ncbi:MAG: archease [Nanoarchaeota archaeon]
MKPFIYLDHTADCKFQAFGKTLEEAFGNAALAMTNFLVPIKEIKTPLSKRIAIDAPRLDTLLYLFLEEIIFLMDTEGFLTAKVEGLKITEHERAKEDSKKFSLTATILGDNYSAYDTKGDIKAMTYSDMEIKQTEEGWMVQVVVDI